ncbi:hypothetical protein EX227_07080 [Providencia rettgeri]|uniref:Uncharacterized protein n=1 Tax=Providencia rettgeri TaxID=587 RepID=A0AAP2NVK0_PRORE|nr:MULTISPECIES: hypothetical protein [Providencia]ELR5214469.1 hypothetical protein [Providencia rettgeri]MBX6950245.1 hypothetical protein [Providencia rettgeri]MBX6954750.1 hypothetical protein [Providencia rettgeri]MBX6959169.1 hypothetical protein [Providencia rettgeri]MBX6972090.1 hypothetical protein [Providencia rettgeri]
MGLRIIGIFVLAVSIILGIYVKATTGGGYFDRFSPIESSMYISLAAIVALMGVILIGCGYIVEAIDRNGSKLRYLLNSDEESNYLEELAEQNGVRRDGKVDKTNHEKIREILKR